MERHFTIKLRPFSLRHRRLVATGDLPDLPASALGGLWATLELFNEYFSYTTRGDSNSDQDTSDFIEVATLYGRLNGLSVGQKGEKLGKTFMFGHVADTLAILECFCARVASDPPRRNETQSAINGTFRDLSLPWRMPEGLAFQVDNDFLEDEIPAEVSPLLALAEFNGAKQELNKARDALTDGDARETVYMPMPALKASLSQLSATRHRSGSSYHRTTPTPHCSACQRMSARPYRRRSFQQPFSVISLEATAKVRKCWMSPIEFGQLALACAAAVNVLISRQHLRRMDVAESLKAKAAPVPSQPPRAYEPDDDISF